MEPPPGERGCEGGEGGGEGGEGSGVGVGEGAELSFPVDVISLSNGWLTVNRTSGELIRIDAESSYRNIVGDGFGLPVSLAQDQTSQEIYVLEAQLNFSGVLVCDPQTGSVRELASPSVGSGPLLIAPRQLLLESGRLLILETLTASLLSLDISSGEREVFASEQLGAGESIAGATRFTLDGSRNALYLLDSFRGRVLQLDLESGLRSEIVSANSESNWSDIKYDNENDSLGEGEGRTRPRVSCCNRTHVSCCNRTHVSGCNTIDI